MWNQDPKKKRQVFAEFTDDEDKMSNTQEAENDVDSDTNLDFDVVSRSTVSSYEINLAFKAIGDLNQFLG
jgi:hypothetical protein